MHRRRRKKILHWRGGKKTAIIPPKHLCKGDVLTIHRGRKSVGNDSRNNWKEIYSKCSISVSLFFFSITGLFRKRIVFVDAFMKRNRFSGLRVHTINKNILRDSYYNSLWVILYSFILILCFSFCSNNDEII